MLRKIFFAILVAIPMLTTVGFVSAFVIIGSGVNFCTDPSCETD